MCSGMLELNLYILLNSVKEPTVGCAGKRWPVNYECCSRSSLKGLNINQEVFFATLYLGLVKTLSVRTVEIEMLSVFKQDIISV